MMLNVQSNTYVLIAFLGYECSPKWLNLKFLFYLSKGLEAVVMHLPTIDNLLYASQLVGIIFSNNNSITIEESSQRQAKEQKNGIEVFLKEKNLNPVFIYENLELDTIRKQIFLDSKNISGIYLILNKVTLDYYIGSASTNRIYARFSNHLIYFRGSKIVKLAVKKYKLSSFVFMVLELFPEIVTKENNKFLLDLEDFYLKSLLPNYNILTEAGSSFGYKHTELDRIKIKSNYMCSAIERRELIGNLNIGQTLSKETINKIRIKAFLREKVDYSNEAQNNMKKNSKKIKVYNLDGTVFNYYPSITDAAKNLNCNIKTINRALKTEKKILKRRFKLSVA